MRFSTLALFAAGAFSASLATAAITPVTDDPYQWLEDVEGQKALDWVRERNADSEAKLADAPGFDALRAQLLEVLDSDARIPYVSKRGGYYYNFWKDKQNPQGVWRRTTPEQFARAEPEWEVLLDLDALGKAEGVNWVWGGAECLRPDYDRCLLDLSRGGADASVTREFDVSDKAFVAGGFSRPEAKGGMEWIDHDTVYVGTDFGDGSMTTSGYPRIGKVWKRGTPMDAATVAFEGEVGDVAAGTFYDDTPGHERHMAYRSLTFYTDELYLQRDGKFVKLDVPDGAQKGLVREWLLLELRQPWTTGGEAHAAGSLIAIRLDAFLAGGRDFDVLFAPTANSSLSSWGATKNHFFINVLEDVKNRITVLTPGPGGWTRAPLAGVPATGNIGISAVDADESDEYFLTVADYLTPSSLQIGTIGGGPPKTLKQLPAFFDASGYSVAQHFATSADGTKVPYFIVAPKDLVLDGDNPTLLYGYGGFEVSMMPNYSGGIGRAWLAEGGVYVVANARGGGEYGPRWHQAALKANRHKAYEDFAAVARDLIARKVTRPERLGIQGGSNGGLMTGNMMVMYPELFGAVVSQVPLLDMWRYHKLLAGASWMAEYGDPDMPAEWAFLQKFSPYHTVRADVDYPPVLFTTSTRDDRVHPGHARKMTARMLEQGHDVTYYENIEGGHGGAANNAQSAYMSALAYTFLKQKLMDAPVAGAPAKTDASAGAAVEPVPPVAAMKPHEVRAPHGAARQDEYYWLRDDKRENAEMLAYLKAENAYTDHVLRPLESLEATIYDELVGRIKQDDASVPYRDDGYWYYTRYETGKEYPIHARRKGAMDAPEQVLFDVNAMAAGKNFFQLGTYEVSPDGRLAAFATDDVGRRQYVVQVKNLETGEVLPDRITGANANLMWGDDNRTLYYLEKDPTTLLTKRVRAHVLGTPTSADALVYEEADDSFYMGVGRTKDDQYLCIFLGSTVSSEQRCTKAADPGEFVALAPRRRDFEYSADHVGGRWVINTNWDAKNFRLMTLADGEAWGDRAKWRELVAHSPDVLISGIELFDDFIAIAERSGGLERLRVLRPDGKADYVPTEESAYSMGLSTNEEPGTDWLRYTYTSLTTPASTYELNVRTGERKLLKEQPVLGGFDRANYVTERLWATARDGTKVPVSVLYRKGFEKDGTGALYQYAYGSYGSSTDPDFSTNVLSLVDRGAVYAIAHIRGGEEMGRAWYDDGKLLNKVNTFTDFIDVTDFLVKEGYAAPDRVAAMGGSAGGLLVGAIANMAPEKYKVLVAHVPFVDVVTTMLDDTIPLTTNEYDEWGNPADAKYYDYMLSYSPYDQVSAQDYPAMLVTTGLWDSQVQYYEPAKWVARLRAKKTDDNPLLFRTNMEAGHGGKSGRFQRYHERAEEYAFVLDQLGLAGSSR